MSELKSTLTFEQFLADLEITARDGDAIELCESYEELCSEVKEEIKAKFNAIDNFSLITEETLKTQLEKYDDGYLGEETKVGDLVWFDGEVECCRDTIQVWFKESFEEIHDNLTYSSWQECANYVKEKFVLNEFDRITKLITKE